MRGRNQRGPEPLGAFDPPPALTPDELEEAVGGGAVVLDVRSPEAFAAGHIPDTVNVGLGPSFATWAGTVLPPDARVALVLDDAGDVMEATWQLLRIGYEPPLGWLAGGMRAYRTSGRPLATLPVATVHDLRERLGTFHLLDVRQPSEWWSYHAPDAQFITGAELPDRLDEVPRDRPVVVTCGSGYRSSVAASLLRRDGHGDVTNLLGGMSAWRNVGLPLA